VSGLWTLLRFPILFLVVTVTLVLLMSWLGVDLGNCRLDPTGGTAGCGD
jgi:hypothetical protein